MLMVFGRIHKPFTIAKWHEAERFQNTSFRNWTLSAIGSVLMDKTAMKWKQGMTEDEKSVVMMQLQKMVPPKALQKYSSPNQLWNYKRLAKIEFLTLIGDILEDEYFWPDIWTTFNRTLPMHTKWNHESLIMNSIE